MSAMVSADDWTRRLASATSCLGCEVSVDVTSLLGARRSLDGRPERATRILRCRDGWIAVTLARPWDREAMPAWIGADGSWGDVTARLADHDADELVEGAELLGLAVGVLGERRGGAVAETVLSIAAPRRGRLRVIDLSALWAGPLCASLLARAGADVLKVESTERPDASRQGTPRLFAALNGAKRGAVLDLGTPQGRDALGGLVRQADVVVESARPRALEQMGIVAHEVLAAATGPQVWVSITGHGRASSRAGFGDDAAVAGGLVGWEGRRPVLWGDAPADPLSGLVAAAVAAEALADGRRTLLDVSLAGVAAELAPSLGVVR
jgi:hypothetical protein